MISTDIIRNSFLGICFIILAILFLKEKQSVKLNWSLFFGFIWMLFALPIINYIAVGLGYWEFLLIKESIIKIPYDILFIWYILWLVPFYFFKGKYTLLICLFLFWIDMLTMPLLESIGLLQLHTSWLIGELLTILFVFLPGYIWGKLYYENKKTWIRVVFQVLIMSVFLTLAIPFLIKSYQGTILHFGNFSAFWVQIIFIIAFPSFVAVIDLAEKGKGTPFPYDKTQNLVRTGVYAYIKNPIQWSFMVLFIPLAIYHESILLLLGLVISVFYTIGISNPQENEDMLLRFTEDWKIYKLKIPSWYFLLKPVAIPKGIIYFKKDCNQCEEIKRWFEKQNAINLDIRFSEVYKGDALLQVTYNHYLGGEYKSNSTCFRTYQYGVCVFRLVYALSGCFIYITINYRCSMVF